MPYGAKDSSKGFVVIAILQPARITSYNKFSNEAEVP